jgi:hypothetical protein
VVTVHLGINDSSVGFSCSGGGESVSTYQGLMQAIANYALGTWGASKIIFMGPPYIRDGAGAGGNHTSNGVALLSQYQSALQAVAATNPTKIFAPMSEYNYFIAHYGDIGTCDFVHPFAADTSGQGGTTNITTMWAHAVYGVLQGNPAPYTHF